MFGLSLFLFYEVGIGFVFAGMELGKVDADKLESFVHYFEPHLTYEDPVFSSEEMESKIKAEAQDVSAWLQDSDSWPKPDTITPQMRKNEAKLHLFFMHLDLPQSYDFALSAYEMIYTAEEDDEEAKAFLLTKKTRDMETDYAHGDFAKARNALKEIFVMQPELESESDLWFAMNMWTDLWGYVPDKVRFETSSEGHLTLVPISAE